jgi:hypothetical protein
VINASKFTSKNNPRRPIGAPTGPTTGQILLGWLAVLPGRLGDRLFTLNDDEAGWRDWQVIKTRGGLARTYRDPRFDRPARERSGRPVSPAAR